ncbi:MAG: hypothetical protein ACLTI1_07935 [Clostridia bacterium]
MVCFRGRLDKDTEGLLLLTDDGELAHRLLSPKSMWIRHYAKIDGQVTENMLSSSVRVWILGDEKKTRRQF